MPSNSDLTEVKVYVARMDERIGFLTDDFKQHRVDEKAFQDKSDKKLDTIIEKQNSQDGKFKGYDRDRAWFVAIFGVLWSGLLVYVKQKLGN